MPSCGYEAVVMGILLRALQQLSRTCAQLNFRESCGAADDAVLAGGRHQQKCEGQACGRRFVDPRNHWCQVRHVEFVNESLLLRQPSQPLVSGVLCRANQ